MKFEVKKEDKYAIIKSHVEKLDNLVAPDLKSELVVLNNNGINNIILDLENTKYCDSSGLSALLIGNRTCKNANGIFIVTNVQPSIQKLFAISQLQTVLTVIPSLNESIDYIFMEEIQKDLEDNQA